jgi:hypothetical protein
MKTEYFKNTFITVPVSVSNKNDDVIGYGVYLLLFFICDLVYFLNIEKNHSFKYIVIFILSLLTIIIFCNFCYYLIFWPKKRISQHDKTTINNIINSIHYYHIPIPEEFISKLSSAKTNTELNIACIDFDKALKKVVFVSINRRLEAINFELKIRS